MTITRRKASTIVGAIVGHEEVRPAVSIDVARGDARGRRSRCGRKVFQRKRKMRVLPRSKRLKSRSACDQGRGLRPSTRFESLDQGCR